MTQWVDGSDERFWTLLPDLGTPRTYVPDPNTAVAVAGGLDVSSQEEQNTEPQHEPEDAEPAESAGEDGADGGFESVGETQ
jgi:hypothetical protein